MRREDTPFERMNRLFERMNRAMYDDFDSSGGASPWGAWSRDDDAEAMPASRDATAMWRFGPTTRRFGDERQFGGGFDTNVSVEETDEGFVVMADVPGFEKEDIAVRFEEGLLTIRGESDVTEEHGGVSRRRNRRVFEQLRFPASVVADEVTASYHNGVLEIALPTEEEAGDDTHRIDIE